MKLLGKLATAAVLATSALVMTAGSASAYIVCNRFGECWHVRSHYAYRPAYGLVVHEDNWRWAATDHYRWHEHAGRGYWRNGVWIRF
jgi:hypothetical protein